MVDSSVVLYGQTLAYTLYCLAMILLMAWFSYRVTRGKEGTIVKPAIFYTFVGFLTVLGVSLHIITYNTIHPILNSNFLEYDITVRCQAYTVTKRNCELLCNFAPLFWIA